MPVTGCLPVPAVNYHLWRACNMRCRHCFATFEDTRSEVPKGYLPEVDAVRVVEALTAAGATKINFAGGEPTLCPWLPKLIEVAHDLEVATSIVTNGSKITDEYLDRLVGKLDWLTLSVDSTDDRTNVDTGRSIGGRPLSVERAMKICSMARERGIRLKCNTVVTALNWEEDLSGFVTHVLPERWKVFQVLPVDGQNNGKVEELLISPEQFDSFVRRHRDVESEGVKLVPESNELMTGSYVMVDPAGRLYDNATGRHRYSRPILEVGVEAALRDVAVNSDTFEQRQGYYDWSPISLNIKK